MGFESVRVRVYSFVLLLLLTIHKLFGIRFIIIIIMAVYVMFLILSFFLPLPSVYMCISVCVQKKKKINK